MGGLRQRFLSVRAGTTINKSCPLAFTCPRDVNSKCAASSSRPSDVETAAGTRARRQSAELVKGRRFFDVAGNPASSSLISHRRCITLRQAYGVRHVSPVDHKWPLGRTHLHAVNGNVNLASRKHGPSWSPWLALAAIALHFILRPLLDPWLNASSDGKFFAALAILALPLLFAAYAFYRSFGSRRNS